MIPLRRKTSGNCTPSEIPGRAADNLAPAAYTRCQKELCINSKPFVCFYAPRGRMSRTCLLPAVFIAFCLNFAAYAPQATAAPPAAVKVAAPPVIYNPNALPPPVRFMRDTILSAAKSGDIEALRPLFTHKNGSTRLMSEESRQDPIVYLKTISADGQGLEILASLVQILQTGAVHLNSGGKEDVYVWPYFVALSPQNLSRAQIVEAYEIMSVDDLDTIKEIGHYIYFRLGIAPDGQWRFFLTGDDTADKAENSAPAMPKRGDNIALPDDSGDLPPDE